MGSDTVPGMLTCGAEVPDTVPRLERTRQRCAPQSLRTPDVQTSDAIYCAMFSTERCPGTSATHVTRRSYEHMLRVVFRLSS